MSYLGTDNPQVHIPFGKRILKNSFWVLSPNNPPHDTVLPASTITSAQEESPLHLICLLRSVDKFLSSTCALAVVRTPLVSTSAQVIPLNMSSSGLILRVNKNKLANYILSILGC